MNRVLAIFAGRATCFLNLVKRLHIGDLLALLEEEPSAVI